jgi:hypothetical protein
MSKYLIPIGAVLAGVITILSQNSQVNQIGLPPFPSSINTITTSTSSLVRANFVIPPQKGLVLSSYITNNPDPSLCRYFVTSDVEDLIETADSHQGPNLYVTTFHDPSFVLVWQTTMTNSYRMEIKSNSISANWRRLPGTCIGNGQIMEMYFPLTLNQMYFRVRID